MSVRLLLKEAADKFLHRGEASNLVGRINDYLDVPVPDAGDRLHELVDVFLRATNSADLSEADRDRNEGLLRDFAHYAGAVFDR